MTNHVFNRFRDANYRVVKLEDLMQSYNGTFLFFTEVKVQKAGRLADNPKRQSLVGGRNRKGNIALSLGSRGQSPLWL